MNEESGDYLIKELDLLIESIKRAKGLNQGEIEKRMKYNKGYLSQVKSRGDVSTKLLDNIKREFGIGLQKANFQANEPQGEYGKDKTIENLSESVRKLTDNNTKMVDALLDKIAVLDSIKISLEQTIPANMSLLTKMAIDGQKDSMLVVMEQFSNLNKSLSSLATAVNKKLLQNQKRKGTNQS